MSRSSSSAKSVVRLPTVVVGPRRPERGSGMREWAHKHTVAPHHATGGPLSCDWPDGLRIAWRHGEPLLARTCRSSQKRGMRPANDDPLLKLWNRFPLVVERRDCMSFRNSARSGFATSSAAPSQTSIAITKSRLVAFPSRGRTPPACKTLQSRMLVIDVSGAPSRQARFPADVGDSQRLKGRAFNSRELGRCRKPRKVPAIRRRADAHSGEKDIWSSVP